MITEIVEELQIIDNRSILSWIKQTINLHHNLPRELYPIPVLIRVNKFRGKSYRVNRLTYQMVELSVNPLYLCE